MSEQVLVFDEKFMSGFKDFQKGPWSNDIGWFEHVLKHCFYIPRPDAESSPEYKQIIPYILFKNDDKYLAYEREGNESRLTGKISVGIGGHINLCDLNSTIVCDELMMDVLTMAALREMDEEISFGDISGYDKHYFVNSALERPTGYIYVEGEEVDRVHFGVIYKCLISKDIAGGIKLLDEGKNLVWKTAEELLKDDKLENWSRIALQNAY